MLLRLFLSKLKYIKDVFLLKSMLLILLKPKYNPFKAMLLPNTILFILLHVRSITFNLELLDKSIFFIKFEFSLNVDPAWGPKSSLSKLINFSIPFALLIFSESDLLLPE